MCIKSFEEKRRVDWNVVKDNTGSVRKAETNRRKLEHLIKVYTRNTKTFAKLMAKMDLCDNDRDRLTYFFHAYPVTKQSRPATKQSRNEVTVEHFVLKNTIAFLV